MRNTLSRLLRPLVLIAAAILLTLLALAGLAHGSESATLRILLEAPRHVSDLDEDDDDRRQRLAELAGAIDAASPHRHERALLLTQSWHESRHAGYVQRDDDKCRLGIDGRCDSSKAYGPIQLHGTKRTESLKWQMRRGISLLRYHAKRCGKPGLATDRSVQVALNGYATGHSCSRPNNRKRVATWRSVMRRMS
jgi:hypothetical protein